MCMLLMSRIFENSKLRRCAQPSEKSFGFFRRNLEKFYLECKRPSDNEQSSSLKNLCASLIGGQISANFERTRSRDRVLRIPKTRSKRYDPREREIEEKKGINSNSRSRTLTRARESVYETRNPIPWRGPSLVHYGRV